MLFEDIAVLCEDRELFSRAVTELRTTREEAARIKAAFRVVFKREVRETCGNCIGDALVQLRALYKQDKEQMKKQCECRYALKAGVLIRLNYGDAEFYSNANLTDEVAEAYIAADPSRRAQFQKLPEDAERKPAEAVSAAEAKEQPVAVRKPAAATKRAKKKKR